MRIKKRNSENKLLVERPVAQAFLPLDKPELAVGAFSLAILIRIFAQSLPFCLDVINLLAALLLPNLVVCKIH